MVARRLSSIVCAMLACVAFWAAGAASAEEQPPPADDPNAAIFAAVNAAMIHGPQVVPLLDQASLNLPEGYGFVPRAEASRMMEVMGNQVGESFIGLVVPLSDKQWFVTVDYEPAGYIKDDDAKDWDADALLDNLREGTEQGNEHRASVGVPAIKVTRWIEPPAYDASSHHLVWSAEVRLRDGEDPDPGVNYNTYVLGREGYVSLDLVTAVSSVEADKPAARELLSAVAFNDGKRYADFDASTDKVAAYGLAALVGGIAAKKLGLIAVIGAFLVKFAKLIIVGVAAAGAGIVKWFKGRSAQQEQA
jgi:uncharacterized membrane-anchored protein